MSKPELFAPVFLYCSMPFSFYIRDDASDLNKKCRVYLQYTYAGKKWRNPATFKGGDPIKVMCANFIKKREFEKLKRARKIKSGDRPQRLIQDGNKRTTIINQQLDNLEENARNIILFLKETGSPTVQRFKDEWELSQGKSRVFGVLDKYIDFKKKEGKSSNAIANLFYLGKRLSEFNESIRFSHFTNEFWSKYQDYHIKYSGNTLALDQRNLKAFLSWSKGKFHDRDDYKNWKSIQRTPRETFLTPEELFRIEAIKSFPKEMDYLARDYFIWLCHSGMRYGEFQSLTPSSLEGEVITYEKKKQRNSKSQNKIILSPTLQRIWDKYKGEFPPVHVVRMNERLKEISKIAGIEKNLSTSVGRHTFGSLMEIFGVDAYTVSKTLGHASTETTRKNYQHGSPLNEGAVLFDMHLRKKAN